jgi:hypothetical protein
MLRKLTETESLNHILPFQDFDIELFGFLLLIPYNRNIMEVLNLKNIYFLQATYSFREDPSAPYGWMTRSHIEPESRTRPDSATSDEMNDNSLEAVSTMTTTTMSRPPTGLRHSHLIRQSKGNPSYAKKVKNHST